MPVSLDRRTFLRLGAAAATTVAISTLVENNPSVAFADAPKPPEKTKQIAPARVELNPLVHLKQTTADLSTRPLNVTQAEIVLTQLTAWNASRNDGILTDPTLIKDTYLLTSGPDVTTRPTVEKDTDPLKHPMILNFYTRYPDYPYSEESAKRLLLLYYTPALGATSNGGIRETFINLDATNNPLILPQRKGSLSFQYHGIEPDPIRTVATPPVILISTGQHEWVHGDNWGLKKPLDKEIIAFLEREYRGQEPVQFTGDQDNFAVNYLLTNSDGAVIPSYDVKLNESVTDFIGTETLRQSGIPFFPGYNFKPSDYYNMTQILKQADINLGILNHLYKNAQLTEFYLAVASAAEKDGQKLYTDSTDNVEKIRFATKILPWWDYPDWDPSPNDQRKLDPGIYYRGLVKAA